MSSSQSDNNTNPNESAESATNQSTSIDVTDELSEDQSSSTSHNNNHSLVQILDEIPPPPYPTQMPTPSHPRDHITITLTSPEYAASNSSLSAITAHPLASSNLSNNPYSTSRDALITPAQELKFCKICQEYEYSTDSTDSRLDENDKKLISPCKCKGSLRYVHIGCLNKWRHSNVRAEASYRCEVCKYEYKFYRPRIAKILSNGITLHLFTLILLLSTIYVLSYIVKRFHLVNVDEDSSWKDIEVPHLNLQVIHIVVGTSIFAFFGIIFFTCMVCLNGFRRTRRDFCYCNGCENACFCGYGGCYAGDCGGSSDFGGVVIIFFLFIIVAIFMFGIVGGVIAAYLFAQKITTFFLGKVHDHILEVD